MTLRLVMIGILILMSLPNAAAEELWFSAAPGSGMFFGEFAAISQYHINGVVELGIRRMFNDHFQTDLEIAYTGYLPSTGAAAQRIDGLQGLQSAVVFSVPIHLGKIFVLSPRLGGGMQWLFASSALSLEDYLESLFTRRVGSQGLLQGGLAMEFLLGEKWSLGLEADYRMFAETDMIHHSADIKLALNRKLADIGGRTRRQRAAPSPDDSYIVDLSPLEGIESIRVFQDGKIVTIVAENSFVSDSTDFTGEAEQYLPRVGEFIRGLDLRSLDILGYVADDQEGKDIENRQLSLLRADAVLYWLSANGYLEGINNPSIRGCATENPVADNSTPEGRARNRRFEIILELP